MNPPQQIQARQTAYIVNIKDLLSGKYVKEDGWNPNYIVIGNEHVSRVNIIGAIISVTDGAALQTMQIDDGTGKITIRNFEKKYDVSVGDVVLCVGRIREYDGERHITPEVMNKKVDRVWNKVWKKLALVSNEEEAEEIAPLEVKEEPLIDSRNEGVIAKIKELDDGDGAPYEDILAAIKDEKILSHLLLQGEIFEIKPGRLKVLE